MPLKSRDYIVCVRAVSLSASFEMPFLLFVAAFYHATAVDAAAAAVAAATLFATTMNAT